ncbi:ankyrin repeat protein [Dictyocaulus viviparus]|uniref:Ankyrin repeat protein n=1 Tax=Dictyocaulus viviparus TaxID=29172 RepID=A0A0D8XF91_DICVI|nr:ankyrin repeat protein [Dictyocaulus viviparus]
MSNSIESFLRVDTSSVLLESLVDFAANGEISSLITPFSKYIGEKDKIVNICNTRGQTALHCAVRAGDPDSVHYLISHGASTKIFDNHRNSVAHYLADAYNEAIYKEILEAPSSAEMELDALNEEGFSPLHLAVRSNNTEILTRQFRLKLSLIEMLLEAGAYINSFDRTGRSVLLHAVNMNDVEIVQLLIDKGADPNVEDESGETPLLLCMKTANYGIMGLLIDAGADPKRRNKNGTSLADSDDPTVEQIISGERVELPAKEIPPPVPTDLTTTRSALFGRSVSKAPANKWTSERAHCSQQPSAAVHSKHEGSETHNRRSSCGQTVEFDGNYVDDQPSTSSGNVVPWKSNKCNKIDQDDISCLDYLTRLRLSKLMDENSKWQQLATELGCSHMIELISICSSDSSPTMILLDQFEASCSCYVYFDFQHLSY